MLVFMLSLIPMIMVSYAFIKWSMENITYSSNDQQQKNSRRSFVMGIMFFVMLSVPILQDMHRMKLDLK